MNFEMLLRALFKFMGVNPDDMREVFDNGQTMLIDAKNRIDMMDRRLERIERALGISETNETKAISNGND